MAIRVIVFLALAAVSLFGVLDGFTDIIWGGILTGTLMYGRTLYEELVRDSRKPDTI